jgi:hypothetical protein
VHLLTAFPSDRPIAYRGSFGATRAAVRANGARRSQISYHLRYASRSVGEQRVVKGWRSQSKLRRTLLLIGPPIVTLALASPALAGQIVYTHGGDLWAMNDSGGNAHVLLTAAQVGGKIGSNGAGGDTGVGVEPNGTGVAFDAEVPPPGGICDEVNHCPGIYSLIGGKTTRLTAQPSPCGSAITTCGGADEDPSVTSNGRVVYYSFFAASTFTGCGVYYCGYDGGLVEQYYSTALDGSQTPTVWPLPAAPGNNDQVGADPNFDGALAADPADPTKIAYTGNYLRNVDSLDGHGCGAGGKSNCYPLDVETSSGTYTQPATDDSFYYGFAFSSDGTKIADIETGDNKGIWVYPSTQSWGTVGSANPSATYTWAVEDPDDVSGAGQFDRVISGLTFVGNDELVVSADNNLWTIPARCWATPVNLTSPAANCHFPGDADQLTHDGTAAAPDADPVWTASTATIKPYGSGSAPSGGNGTKLALTLKRPSNQKLLKQKALDGSVLCNETCGVAVAGGVRIKGSHKTLLTKRFTKVLSARKIVKFSLPIKTSALKAIRKALSEHKRVTAQIVASAKDAAGHKASHSATFTVKR